MQETSAPDRRAVRQAAAGARIGNLLQAALLQGEPFIRDLHFHLGARRRQVPGSQYGDGPADDDDDSDEKA
jgi:hypothetical protein